MKNLGLSLDNVFIALAIGVSAKQIMVCLKSDPEQSSPVGIHAIHLRHPVNGGTKHLPDYVSEIQKGSRFAIETDDAYIFVSRLTIQGSEKKIYIPTGILSKRS